MLFTSYCRPLRHSWMFECCRFRSKSSGTRRTMTFEISSVEELLLQVVVSNVFCWPTFPGVRCLIISNMQYWRDHATATICLSIIVHGLGLLYNDPWFEDLIWPFFSTGTRKQETSVNNKGLIQSCGYEPFAYLIQLAFGVKVPMLLVVQPYCSTLPILVQQILESKRRVVIDSEKLVGTNGRCYKGGAPDPAINGLMGPL